MCPQPLCILVIELDTLGCEVPFTSNNVHLNNIVQHEFCIAALAWEGRLLRVPHFTIPCTPGKPPPPPSPPHPPTPTHPSPAKPTSLTSTVIGTFICCIAVSVPLILRPRS